MRGGREEDKRMHKVVPMTCAPSQQLLSLDGELLTINLGLALAKGN